MVKHTNTAKPYHTKKLSEIGIRRKSLFIIKQNLRPQDQDQRSQVQDQRSQDLDQMFQNRDQYCKICFVTMRR